MTATIDGTTGLTAPSGAIFNGIASATAVASTSGTSINFTSIPAWVKRITVMLNVVSTSGTSNLQVQIGAGSVDTSGYTSVTQMPGLAATSTAAFLITTQLNTAADTNSGVMTLVTMGSNIWQETCICRDIGNNVIAYGQGVKTLSGTLDRVRLTTVNGTDTFDAGSVNILYE